jgi:hypothetical protein
MTSHADATDFQLTDRYSSAKLDDNADQSPISHPVDDQGKIIRDEHTEPERLSPRPPPSSSTYRLSDQRKAKRSHSLSLPSPRDSLNQLHHLHHLLLAIPANLTAPNSDTYDAFLQYLRTHAPFRPKNKKQHKDNRRPSASISKTKTSQTQTQTQTQSHTHTYNLNSRAAACRPSQAPKCRYGSCRPLTEENDDKVNKVCSYHKKKLDDVKKGKACEYSK